MFWKYAANLQENTHAEVQFYWKYNLLRFYCNFAEVLCNFIEIVLWLGCSPVNLLHIFRTPFPKNTSGPYKGDLHLTCQLAQETQNVNWTYIRRSEDVQGVFRRSYIRSIYIMCLRGPDSGLQGTSLKESCKNANTTSNISQLRFMWKV